MAMVRAARLAQTVPVRVVFDGGVELNVESRRAGRGYKVLKELVDVSRETGRIVRRSAKLQRDLEKLVPPEIPALANSHTDMATNERAEFEAKVETATAEREKIEALREPIENEIAELEARSTESVECLIDWMAGRDGQPGAIADWDYFEDEAHTQKVAITRERLEEFETLEIVTLANAILEKINVGESNPAS